MSLFNPLVLVRSQASAFSSLVTDKTARGGTTFLEVIDSDDVADAQGNGAVKLRGSLGALEVRSLFSLFSLNIKYFYVHTHIHILLLLHTHRAKVVNWWALLLPPLVC